MVICQHKQHAQQGGEWRATNLVAMTARCALVTDWAQSSAAERSRTQPSAARQTNHD